MKKTFLILILQIAYASDNYYYRNGQKTTITPTNLVSRNNTNIDYYQNSKGIILGVTDKLLVKLKDAEKLEELLNEFALTVEKTLGKKLYLVKTTTKELTIDISNRLSEKEYIEYAHPNFIKNIMSR